MTNTLLFKEAVNANRTLFDTVYRAGVAVQAESEQAVNEILGNLDWLNDDVRSAVADFSGVARREQDRVKAFIDDGFDNLEGLFKANRRNKRASAKK